MLSYWKFITGFEIDWTNQTENTCPVFFQIVLISNACLHWKSITGFEINWTNQTENTCPIFFQIVLISSACLLWSSLQGCKLSTASTYPASVVLKFSKLIQSMSSFIQHFCCNVLIDHWVAHACSNIFFLEFAWESHIFVLSYKVQNTRCDAGEWAHFIWLQ